MTIDMSATDARATLYAPRAENVTASLVTSAVESVAAPPSHAFSEPGGMGTLETFSVDPIIEEAWSKSKERRFCDLAAMSATGAASPKQRQEFDALRNLRRKTKNPLPPEEVLFQYRRRQMEAHLMRQLQEYVEFLKTPRGAQT